MTIEQKNALGLLIWSGVPEGELPGLPLAYFSYLHLPHPEEVDVVKRVKEHILNLSPVKAVSVGADGSVSYSGGQLEERMISEVAMASKPVVQLADETKGLIDWNRDDAKVLWLKALDWWSNDKAFLRNNQEDALFGGWGRDAILATLERFDFFLARAIFPYMHGEGDEEWNPILDFLSEAKEKGVYLVICLPYILLHRPDQKSKVETEIGGCLSAGTENAVNAGAAAVRHWVHLSSMGSVEESDRDLLGDLINRVIYRRREGIHSCIRQVSLLLLEKPDSFSWERVQALLASLVPWHDVIRLPAEAGICGDFPEEERPDLRALIGMLAAALAKWLSLKKSELDELSEIKLWRETCDQDPLPEVRRSFKTWNNFKIRSED